MLMLNSLNWKKTRIFALEFLKLKEGIFEAEIPSIRNVLFFLRMNKSQNFKPREFKGNLAQGHTVNTRAGPSTDVQAPGGLPFHVTYSPLTAASFTGSQESKYLRGLNLP